MLLLKTPAGVNYVIEITEHQPLKPNEKTVKLIKRLKTYEVGIALDDFGTGYSNLNSLLTNNFDYVKIPRVFTKGVENNENKLLVVKSFLSLISNLGSMPVLENIDNLSQYNLFIENK